jgi:hypothetical protein
MTTKAMQPRTAIPYRQAISWLAFLDDTEFVENGDPISITACLVADIYRRTEEEVVADLRKYLVKGGMIDEPGERA